MQYSNYRISLDVQTGGSGAVLTAKRGDTGRRIYVNLTDGGRPYFPEADCMAVFTARKPDGHVIFQECTWDGSLICYVLSEQLLAVPGEVKCELRLYGGDTMLLTSADFDLLVEDTVYHEGDEIESSDEFSVLTDLISRNQELMRELGELINSGGGGGGTPGKDGFSPIVTVTQSADGATISITDAKGTTTAKISNGKDGADGKDGKDGANGAPGKDGADGKTPIHSPDGQRFSS